MNKKVLLGVLIGGIVVATVLPVSARVFPGLDPVTLLSNQGNKIIIDDDEIEKVIFKLTGSPNTGDVFGGYGALSGNSLLVVTSHPGFYDSDKQNAPSDAQTEKPISPTAAVCNTSDGVCEKVWHTHLANLANDALARASCVPNFEDDPNTPNNEEEESQLRVESLTFEEPSEKVKVKSNKIIVKEVEGDDDFINSLTAQEMEFLLGDYAGSLVSFNLFPGNLTPVVVCVEDIQAVEVPAPDDDDDDDDDDD